MPSTRLHGVLLEVYGLGVLLIGDSGVGKSESALDLITRGHSLVADDRVDRQALPERRAGRLLRGAAAPPHGAARHRHRQRSGPLRPRRGARAEDHRPGDRARELAARARPTTASGSTRASTPSSTPRSPTSACRWRWGATSRSWSRSPPATTSSRCRATTRRGGSRASSSASWSAAVRPPQGRRPAAAGPVEIGEGPPPDDRRTGHHHRAVRLGKSDRRQGLRGPRLLHRRQPAAAAAAVLPRAPGRAGARPIRASRWSPTSAPPGSPRSCRSWSATSTARRSRSPCSSWRPGTRSWCGASPRPGGPIRWPPTAW